MRSERERAKGLNLTTRDVSSGVREELKGKGRKGTFFLGVLFVKSRREWKMWG